MKKALFFIVFSSICFSMDAQSLYRLKLDDYQLIENNTGTMGGLLKLPIGNVTVVMGGSNDWDGMNNYFSLFGSNLIIDSLDRGSDGTLKVVLRREDGRDFFDLFPTISATLIPVIYPEKENEGSHSLE